jgi:hypothetical protein
MAESKYGKYIVTRPKAEMLKRKTDFSRGSPPEEHDHDFDEYLGFLGTNPDDVYDLGGEVEVWLGGEKHLITETCAIFIPAGLKHAPIYFRRVDRPI